MDAVTKRVVRLALFETRGVLNSHACFARVRVGARGLTAVNGF
jgi:ribosomal protein L28